jgi:uridylate kinase
LDELKNKIENEIIKLDGVYEKINEEASKYYELQREQLIKEENELKDKLKNEVTKIKEKLELNISNLNNTLRNCERIIKGIKLFKV